MVFSEELATSVYIVLEVLVSSETLMHFYQTTWHHIAADSKLHSNLRENLTYLENSLWCRVRVLRVFKF